MGHQPLDDMERTGHILTVVNRETVRLEGVLNVESFDDEQVLLETELGFLSITGEDLHIRELDLEAGRLYMDGLLNSLTYTTAPTGRRVRSGRLFERLFR